MFINTIGVNKGVLDIASTRGPIQTLLLPIEEENMLKKFDPT